MTDQHRNRRAKAAKPGGRRVVGGEEMRRGGGLRRMPDLLGRVLDPASRRRGLAEARLLTEWSTIAGPRLAARCQPVRLSGTTLHLHVSGAAALELQHGAPQVVERINEFLGHPAVARLRLVQAPLPLAPDRGRAAAPPPLSETDAAAVTEAVRAVDDPTLQAALTSLGRTLKARRAGAP